MLDTVRPWESLSDDEKRLFVRMAEVFAGYISYYDDRLGRKRHRDLRAQIVVQGQHVEQEGADVHGLHGARARLPCIDREVVDHVLHRGDLRNDGLRAACQGFLIGAVELRRELSLQPLRRQLDRRQRILDFVRQPASDLSPRRVTLRLRASG